MVAQPGECVDQLRREVLGVGRGNILELADGEIHADDWTLRPEVHPARRVERGDADLGKRISGDGSSHEERRVQDVVVIACARTVASADGTFSANTTRRSS